LNHNGQSSRRSGFKSRGAVDGGNVKNRASWRDGVLAIILCHVRLIRWPEISRSRISKNERILERSSGDVRTRCEALRRPRLSRPVGAVENG
jgi:hypothetical protein